MNEDIIVKNWIKFTKMVMAQTSREDVKRAVDDVADLVNHRAEDREIVKDPETPFSAERSEVHRDCRERFYGE